MTPNPDDILPARKMWAAVRPTRNGKFWIDYSSVRYRARDVRAAASQNLTGGWDYLRKRGWTVARVDVVASE